MNNHYKDIISEKYKKILFIHGWGFTRQKLKDNFATTNYGINFLSYFNINNVYGTQFHPEKSQANGLKLLNNYMEIEDPTSFDPLERERWVRGSINDLNLRGILDRMDRNQNGDLIIVDYKSGKAPMAKYKEPRFFALKLYALLIKEELGEMPVELKLIYLKNSTIHTLKITEEDLSNAKNEILEIWANIKKAYEENEFPAIKNTLCDWCYYKPICPVFNENAPNTENLRIINESIAALVEEIEVLDMFKDDYKIPVDSPIGNTNRKDIESKISELENQKNEIQTEIEKLLREQSSS